MVHYLKKISCFLCAYWLLVCIASCSMPNIRSKKISGKSESPLEIIDDSFLGLPDSVLINIPILSGDCLSSEQKIWDLGGVDLPTEGEIVILRSMFPESFVSLKDLENRFAPHYRVCIVGRWIVNHSIDTYILKIAETNHIECNAVSLVSKKGNTIIDILDVAFISQDYTVADDTMMPELSEIKDGNKVIVFNLDGKNKRGNEKMYTITDSGEFELVSTELF